MFTVERQLELITTLKGVEEVVREEPDVADFKVTYDRNTLFIHTDKKNQMSIVSIFKNRKGFLTTSDIIVQETNVLVSEVIKSYRGYLR